MRFLSRKRKLSDDTEAFTPDERRASIALAMSVVGYFELDEGKPRVIVAEVGKAVTTWREDHQGHA